jgi:hypothetical protein
MWHGCRLLLAPYLNEIRSQVRSVFFSLAGVIVATFSLTAQPSFPSQSLVGVFNTIWLLPVYVTAEESSEPEDITDLIVKTTIANVPSGSSRMYATIIASYFIFGYAMYAILQEFTWYIEMHHKFLRKPLARNFSVFVRNIPPAYQDNRQLADFFRG